MDSVLREARASVESWQRPCVGPGASRSSSAGARLILEPLSPESGSAAAGVRADVVVHGAYPQPPQEPMHGRAPRPVSLGRRPSSSGPAAHPDTDCVLQRALVPPRASRPPVPSTRSAAPNNGYVADARSRPRPEATTAEEAHAEAALEVEEMQLLQELEDLQARLTEKETSLLEIAGREALLRDAFAASREEAHQLRLQVAELESGLQLECAVLAEGVDNPSDDRTDVTNGGQALEEHFPEVGEVALKGYAADDDARLRARLAMGLTASPQ